MYILVLILQMDTTTDLKSQLGPLCQFTGTQNYAMILRGSAKDNCSLPRYS